jgi:2,4-dienoyl-CoA reductase-like NADH-dependent reductase (Old Yellow Enzyme family)
LTWTEGGLLDDRYFPNAELAEQHRQFEVSMRQLLAEHRADDGTPDETDQLSQRVDAARTTLESACRPFLADPHWLKTLSDTLRRWRLG